MRDRHAHSISHALVLTRSARPLRAIAICRFRITANEGASAFLTFRPMIPGEAMPWHYPILQPLYRKIMNSLHHILAQVARPAGADWIEPFVIGIVVGFLTLMVVRKFYKRF